MSADFIGDGVQVVGYSDPIVPTKNRFDRNSILFAVSGRPGSRRGKGRAMEKAHLWGLVSSVGSVLYVIRDTTVRFFQLSTKNSWKSASAFSSPASVMVTERAFPLGLVMKPFS
uniref:Uncharacterized protein n=1 Tax=Candidatus Kentrum sp. LFY TaxID=2126342 RepID=A0A450UGX1_9GAMM|nr:MAG: hypothetical protein BECKLFY1418A_GA0070994_101814 [Candidatus Kentron sp. LFY]